MATAPVKSLPQLLFAMTQMTHLEILEELFNVWARSKKTSKIKKNEAQRSTKSVSNENMRSKSTLWLSDVSPQNTETQAACV